VEEDEVAAAHYSCRAIQKNPRLIHSYLESVLRHKFLILGIIRTLYIYVSKDVRILGYFLKPKGAHEPKVWETLPQTLEEFEVTTYPRRSPQTHHHKIFSKLAKQYDLFL
jgi:hypothetical protein